MYNVNERNEDDARDVRDLRGYRFRRIIPENEMPMGEQIELIKMIRGYRTRRIDDE